MSVTSGLAITVAICTKDRPEQLERLLRSIASQSRDPHEVLIIDNAPATERTRQLVSEEFPSCRYVREPVPGLDFARNRALHEATGTVLAFIDDDAVANRDWVEASERVFAESPHIAVCMGKVDALSLEHEGARLFEANGGFGRGSRRIHLPPGAGPRPPGAPRPLIAWSISAGSGVSMAIRRSVLEELDGFDVALDMGAALPGGGDLDILWRVLEAGHQVVYEPRVGARHEHRRDRGAAEMQILEHNRALIATLTKLVCTSGWRWKPSILGFLLWRLVKPFKRLLSSAVGRDPLPLGLLWRLVGHTWRGLAAYPKARRLALARAALHGGRDAPVQP